MRRLPGRVLHRRRQLGSRVQTCYSKMWRKSSASWSSIVMHETARNSVRHAVPHNTLFAVKTAHRGMNCSIQHRRRWQALSMLFLACLILCRVVRCESATTDTPTRQSLQEKLPLDIMAEPQQEGRYLNVFGENGDQQVSDSTAFPYSAVGLLRWNDNVSCTATLVAPSFVLTAAECVLDSDGELLAKSRSSPEFIGSQVSDVSKAFVTRVHKQSEFWTEWTRNTYALVELDDELGATRSVLRLPAANTFPQDAATDVQLVGYTDNEEEGMCFQLCKVHFPSEFDGPQYMLHHDCDVSVERSPGSPLLVRSTNLDTYIIGIHSNAIGDNQSEDDITHTYSNYDDTVANRGVLGSFIQPHLSFLLQQADSSSTSSLEFSSSFVVDQSFDGEGSNSSSSFLVGSTSSNLSTGQEYPRKADPKVTLTPSSASSSSAAEVSVASPPLGIAATAAYSCIGLVCASWLAIIFIAARRYRSGR